MKEYYKYYLTLHQDIRNIRMHVIGQIFTILYILLCVVFRKWFLLIFFPFIVYPFAWSGHYFFEKNKPAAFNNPIKAKISDWIMFKDYFLNNLTFNTRRKNDN